MNFLRPVYWHEGMLLRPEHFQQQDRYHETLTQILISQVNPYYWGVFDLNLRAEALINQMIEIDSCGVILKDGTTIRYPGNARVENRSFEKHLPATGRPLSVYLGIKGLKPSENNAYDPNSSLKSTEGCRYRLDESAGLTFDLFAAGQSSPIDFLCYDLRVFFNAEKDQAGDYRLIKIAEIIQTEKGPAWGRKYIPPVPGVNADPILLELLKKVRDITSAKARELAEHKKNHGLQTHELGARDMLPLLYALTINRYVPLLHHMTGKGWVHPMAAHGLLRAMIGELSVFSQSIDYLGAGESGEVLPDYNHEDLYGCFEPITRLIEQLLSGLLAQAAYTAKLVWDGQYYSADLDEAVFRQKATGANRYYLIISTTTPANDLLNMIRDTAKICSREGLPMLITRALFGVPVTHLPVPPPQLPQRAHGYYFLLDHSAKVWSRVEIDKSLAISFENKQLENADITFTMLAD
ncbi:MAG: type VI secretion system baseplate subunit TssK [Deltaproteobacteria bacterium]|nr:type VI secretion system baseplate subunit TssK [Deltaproteobacteria bacterium]